VGQQALEAVMSAEMLRYLRDQSVAPAPDISSAGPDAASAHGQRAASLELTAAALNAEQVQQSMTALRRHLTGADRDIPSLHVLKVLGLENDIVQLWRDCRQIEDEIQHGAAAQSLSLSRDKARELNAQEQVCNAA